MNARILGIAVVIALAGIALDGAPVLEDTPLTTVLEPATASTCDGWPYPVGKILDECPHGPTP